MVRRIHAIVTGLVQGVSYRYSTQIEATRLGLAGWVRNRDDGAVELEAEGPDAQIEKLVAWCQHGPSYARVDGVAVEERTATGEDTAFTVRR